MIQYEGRSARMARLAGRWLASIALASLFLVAGSTAREAEARPSPGAVVVSDTIPLQAPRLFQKRMLFSPEYLRRALDEATARKAAEAVEARADAYAERYGISAELAATIIRSAEAEGIDPELGFRLVRVESVFKTNARGPGGALGLTQLMPSTARSLDRSLRTDAQIMEPVTNLRTGFRYLRTMIDRYDGDVRLAVLAYNRGEVAVDRAIRTGRDPENGYSPKVLGTATNRYTGSGVIEEAE